MVDHEITTGGIFSDFEELLLPDLSHFSRQCSVDRNEIKEILEKHDARTKKMLRSKSLYDAKPPVAEKWDNDLIPEKLLVVVGQLLSVSSDEFHDTSASQEIKVLERAYRSTMEKFLLKLSEFLRSIKEMRNELRKSLQEFRVISRSTAHITLASSVATVALVMSSVAQKIFHFSWHPKMSMIHTVVGAISFTTSLLALSHMKRTTTDMSRDMRKEWRLLHDLIVAHRKGDWIDSEVLKMFPYKIDLKFFDKKALEDGSYFKTKYLWKKHLCSAIILGNIQNDAKLLADEEFLTRVKLFVESPTAEIWWNRIKIKYLLEEIRKKVDKTPVKQLLSGHEEFIHRTALYLYPVLIPWLVNSWNSEEMMFICSSLAGILAAFDLGNDDTEEFEKLKETSQGFEKEFKIIKKICEELDSIDD